MGDKKFILPIWVVYRNPKDYPNDCVARRWDGLKPTNDIIVNKSLAAVRRKLKARNLVILSGNDDDDACIVETWV